MIKLPDNDSNKKMKRSGIRRPFFPFRNSFTLWKLGFLGITESTSIKLWEHTGIVYMQPLPQCLDHRNYRKTITNNKEKQ